MIETAGILLIVTMCVVGALIAYFADLLGRNLGKKRLSLFGMRPKHTAALLTATAGFLIPIVTIGLLYASFADVRVMLQEGSRAARERDERLKELRVARTELFGVRGEVQELGKARTDLKRENDALLLRNKQLSESQGRLERALTGRTRDLKRTESSLEKSRKTVSLLDRASKALGTRVKALSGEVNLLQNTKEQLDEMLRRVNRELNDTNQRQYELEVQQAQMTRRSKQLEVDITALKADQERLVDEGDKFLRQIEALQREKAALDQSIASVDLQRVAFFDEIRRLEGLRDELLESIDYARTRPLVFNRDQEVGRIVVPPNSSAGEAQLVLTSFFREMRLKAEGLGATKSASYESVSLIPLKDKERRDVSVSQQLEDLVRSATNQPEPTAWIAESLINTFVGEFVRIQVRSVANTVVYKEGDVIAETRIDGSIDEQVILGRLNDFATSRVAPAAVQKGMIPIGGPGGGLGSLSDAEVLRIVNELKEYGRPVRIQALAARTTRRADRLEIRFRMR